MSAAPTLVDEAVYGYWSIVASTPRALAASTSASVSVLRPQFLAPTTLWCVTCVGSPPRSPIAMVSRTLSTIFPASSRMWDW